jgi:YD repeat-containing protein
MIARRRSFGFINYFFLTQRVSPEGYTTTFQYEGYDPDNINVRLKYVIDPDGRTNTLTYATGGFSTNLITQVTDPYGRSAYFQYDNNGLLTNITDMAGMSSSMRYDANGWLTNLTTPYGATSFAPTDNGEAALAINRYITITEPGNSKHLYVFYQDGGGWEPASFPASEVPTNTPVGTLDNAPNARNSYYWGPLQYPLLSGTNPDNFSAADAIKGRLRHWLGITPHGDARSMDTLSIERDFSPDGLNGGQKTWYDYTGKTNSADQGGTIFPAVIAQVVPDGSTRYVFIRRDSWQRPTNVVSTYTKSDNTRGTRTNRFIYAANGIDLVQHLGPEGEQVVSNYFGNIYHQPDATYDALNQATAYTYNANRQLTSTKTPAGLTTTNIYFTTGNGTRRIDRIIDLEINRTNAFTYYANGLVNTHTDERGLTTTQYWDNLLRLTGVSYPDGTSISNTYRFLDLARAKDRLGNWTSYGYDSLRRKVAETNANNVVTRYAYCDCGSLLYQTNAAGTPVQQVISFGYDAAGNRLTTAYPDAYNVTNWYDSLRRVTATGDGTGYRWLYYNSQGLLTVVSNAYGLEQKTVFDIQDRPLWVTDANGVTLTNSYDSLHRLRTRTYPDGGVEKFGYSARGLTAYTNQLNLTNFFGYDAAGRKTAETNANSEVLRFTNNAAGDLLSLTDGKNQTTRWLYDPYGRVTNKLDQAGAVILKYSYDPGNRLTNRWSAAKGTTVYTYDTVGNLTFVNYPASTDVTFQYDPLNRLTNMVDASGTTKYTYTSGNLLMVEDGPFASDNVTNAYQNRMRASLSLQQPLLAWTNAFKYDLARRLTNVTSPAGAFVYSYKAGQGSRLPTKILLPSAAYSTNTYDPVAGLTGTFLKNSSHATLDAATYGYNPAGQRTTFTNAAGTNVSFAYDRIGQLAVADSAVNTEDRGYFYDAAWNLNRRTNNGATSTFTVDGRNQLTSDPGGGCGHDGNGNMTSRLGGTQTLSYDDENRLVSITHSTSFRTDFVYDGLGRLRARTEHTWSGSAWIPSTPTQYLYDGWRVIQERATSPTVSYTRGADLSGSMEGAGGIGGLLARSSGYSGGNWGTHFYYHADGNGNVTYLVDSAREIRRPKAEGRKKAEIRSAKSEGNSS